MKTPLSGEVAWSAFLAFSSKAERPYYKLPYFLSLYNHNIAPVLLRRKTTARNSYLRINFLLANDITVFLNERTL